MAVTHPWPSASGDARRSSIAEVRAGIESVTSASVRKSAMGDLDALDLAIDRTAAVVSARVERYAPMAPAAVKTEAVVRGTAWLLDTLGAERVRLSGGPVSSEPPPVHSGPWFRQSGCMSLLSPWRARNAGVVQEAT